MEVALRAFFGAHLEVVAQEIESELVVGAVGDIGVVLLLSFAVVEFGVDASCGESECVEDPSHPSGVSFGEVVVDGDDVDSFFVERVERGGQGGDERLAFACFHLGDVAFVQGDSSDDLHIEVGLLECARRRFAHEREGLWEERVEGASLLALLSEFVDLFFEVAIGELSRLGGELGGLYEEGFEGFKGTFVCRAKEAEEGGGKHGGSVAKKTAFQPSKQILQQKAVARAGSRFFFCSPPYPSRA